MFCFKASISFRYHEYISLDWSPDIRVRASDFTFLSCRGFIQAGDVITNHSCFYAQLAFIHVWKIDVPRLRNIAADDNFIEQYMWVKKM